jgi:hypothetical protein
MDIYIIKMLGLIMCNCVLSIYLFSLILAPSVIMVEEDHIFSASRYVISGSVENISAAHIWYPVGCLSVLPGDIILQTYINSCLLLTSESGT